MDAIRFFETPIGQFLGTLVLMLLGMFLWQHGFSFENKMADVCPVDGTPAVVTCDKSTWPATEIVATNVRRSPQQGEIVRCRWVVKKLFGFEFSLVGRPVCRPHTMFYSAGPGPPGPAFYLTSQPFTLTAA